VKRKGKVLYYLKQSREGKQGLYHLKKP